MTLNSIIEDLKENIAYRMEEGEVSAEIDPAVLLQLERGPGTTPKRITVHTAVSTAPHAETHADTTSGKTSSPETTAAISAEMAAIAAEIAACELCELHQTRNRTVPGQGHDNPAIMFVGEAPGADEDAQGVPFVGRAGKLLTRMLERLGLSRDEVFIANILKCRPPKNRTPLPAEIAVCRPYLERQIKQLKPKVIVALGGTAMRGLLGEETPISKLRGKWMTYQDTPLMPTFHPSYLLRNRKARWEVWNDMLEVLKRCGYPPPETKNQPDQ